MTDTSRDPQDKIRQRTKARMERDGDAFVDDYMDVAREAERMRAFLGREENRTIYIKYMNMIPAEPCLATPTELALAYGASPDKTPPDPAPPQLADLTALELCLLLVDDPTLRLILVGPDSPRLPQAWKSRHKVP